MSRERNQKVEHGKEELEEEEEDGKRREDDMKRGGRGERGRILDGSGRRPKAPHSLNICFDPSDPRPLSSLSSGSSRRRRPSPK